MTEERKPPTDLKPGDWQMECRDCGWRFEKNVAGVQKCPECRGKDFILWSEPKQ